MLRTSVLGAQMLKTWLKNSDRVVCILIGERPWGPVSILGLALPWHLCCNYDFQTQIMHYSLYSDSPHYQLLKLTWGAFRTGAASEGS